MKTRFVRTLVLFAVSVTPALATWNYDYNPRQAGVSSPPNLSSWDSSTFTKNGTVPFASLPNSPNYPSQPNAMVGGGSGVAGSLIETASPYAGAASQYEISTVIRINTGDTADFIHYVRSKTTSLQTSIPSGPFFTVELGNLQFTPQGCMGTLSFWQSDGTNATLKAQTQVPCYDHMQMRTVVFNPGPGSFDGGTGSAYVWTMINGQVYSARCDIATGNPGIGLYNTAATSGFESVQIGSRNLAAPALIDRATLATSSFPDRVDLHWTDPVDTTGVGITDHTIFRNGVDKGFGYTNNNYTDDVGVQPQQTYTYQIYTISFHGVGNTVINFPVTTPAAGSVDPRRVGVKPTGSYWGALGENIDNLSGNLNFTVPLLQTKARGGWGVNFNLIYNSQMWRKDAGGTWMMGQDVGYGMGWRLMAGSVTPAWDDTALAVDHYTFADSTGAEYRLNVNNGGVWTSTESIYVSFDSNTNRLWFQNGSFWYMGSTSGGDEQDAGTQYPTLMQDKNGNQIVIYYDAGLGTNYYNSSARITNIVDIRTVAPAIASYTFQYNFIGRTDGGSDLIPHLTAIKSNIQTGETYYFYRVSGQTLASPWNDAYGVTDVLQQVVGAANPANNADPYAPNRTYRFLYDPSAQMTKAALPTGGYMRWDFGLRQFSSNRTQSEVLNRYLSQDVPGQSGGTGEMLYQISHEGTSGTVHNTTNIIDPTNAAKVYHFTDTSANTWQIGLLASFQKWKPLFGTLLESDTVTWAQSASNNPYVQVMQTQVDNTVSKTQQTVDIYGNVTEQDLWDYPGSGNPTRKYLYQYAHNQSYGNYTGFYIRNALTSKTVTDGNGQNQQGLLGIGYDGSFCSSASYNAPPPPVDLTNAFLHDPSSVTAHNSGGIAYSGNPTTFTTPGSGTTCKVFDAAGTPYLTEGPGQPRQVVTVGADSNFSAPSSVQLNQDQGSLTQFAYTTGIAVGSYSGPNGVTGSLHYDSYGQPYSATLTTGGSVGFAHYPGGLSGPGYAGSAYPASYFPNSTNGFPWAELSYIGGHYTRKTLDGLGRVVRVEQGPTGLNSMGAPTSVVDTRYGPCACSPVGKMTQQSQPYKPGDPVYWTTYTYDGMGRTISVSGPDGQSTTTMTYNAQANQNVPTPPTQGSSVTTIDPKGNWKIVTTDAFGNTTQVTEPNPANAAQPLMTFYTYNKVNQLTLVQLPRDGYTQMRTFNYDPGTLMLMSETQPETGTTTYQYYQGNHYESLLALRQDAKGQQRKIDRADYDVYNRVKKVQFWAPTPSQSGALSEDLCQRVTYTYDTYANVGTGLGNSGWGRMTSSQVGPGGTQCAVATDQYGTITYQNYVQAFGYTPAGQMALKRLLVTQQQVGPTIQPQQPVTWTWDTAYQYDLNGYQTQVQYPTGRIHQTGYDTMGRPNTLSVANSSTPIITGVTYNAADQPVSMSWGDNNGSTRDPDAYSYSAFTQTWAYNSFNQVTQIQMQNSAGTPAGTDLNYVYPAGHNNGQVSSVASGIDANYNATYTYDQLGRLTALGGAKIQNYSYDGWGNLYSKTGDGQVFTVGADPTTNRLVVNGSICYDPNGNMVGMQHGCGSANAPTEYQYDISNRLVGAVSAQDPAQGQRERYWYTADNKRVSTLKIGNAGVLSQVFFVYGAHGEMSAVCTAQLFAATPVCDTAEIRWAGRLVRQAHLPVITDRLGSVVANPPNAVGAGPNRYYQPYGDGPVTTSSPVTGGTAFATYWADLNTGLNYADQRYQSSGFGRFMSADPYRTSGGPNSAQAWNKYSYVVNDPANLIDPQGLFQCDPDTGTSITVCANTDLSLLPVYLPGTQSSTVSPDLRRQTSFDRATNRLMGAQEQISNRSSFSQNCEHDASSLGLTAAQIAETASGLDFENGTTSTLPVSELFGSAEAAGRAFQAQEDRIYGPGQTIADEFRRNPTGLTADTVLLGNFVFINPSLIGSASLNNQGLLFHEALHALGLIDTDIQLVLFGKAGVDPKNTTNITTRLINDCFRGKDNY